jgi:hypothetical protein
MKKLLLIGLLTFLAHTTLLAQEIHGTETKLDIYYFHGNLRCATCLAVEKETRALVDSTFKNELATGILRLTVLNLEKPDGHEVAQKYGVWGSSLLLVNDKGEKTDMTQVAFRLARNKPEEFDEALQTAIQQQLGQAKK